MKRSFFLLAAGLLAMPLPVAAQTGNVNDCTLIKDAIELRDCILRYGNVRTQPPATIESGNPATPPTLDSATSLDSEIVEVPTPSAARKTLGKRSDKPAPKRPEATAVRKLSPQEPPLPRPNPNDTITHIEQIDMAKVKP